MAILVESDQHALICETSIEAKRLSDVELHRCTKHRLGSWIGQPRPRTRPEFIELIELIELIEFLEFI